MTLPTVWVLGAGASAASGRPTLKNFFRHVFDCHGTDERVIRVGRFLRDFFKAAPEDRGRELPKYELVLSFIDLALQSDMGFDARWHDRELFSLRDDLVYLIWLTLRGSGGGEADATHLRFVEERLAPGDSVISLNYDLLIDQAMLQVYGSLDYGIDFARILREDFRGEVGENSAKPSGKRPRLLKIHGSLNWLFCPTCGGMTCYLGDDATERIFREEAERCPEDESYLKGVLIPPRWVKTYRNPHLKQLWFKAEDSLRHAGRAVFVGYSLAENDVPVLFSFARALHNNPHGPRIEVVNPERRDVIRRRYRRLFGDVRYHATTFDAWIEG